jgi:LemA protein
LALVVVVAIVAAAAGWLIVVYNGLVRLRNGAQNAFATVDVQLKQRCDLVPNVVAAVKGYMQHERQLLERLTALRTLAVGGGLSDQKRLGIDTQMSGLLQRLMLQVENYPELKANQNMELLQRTLNEIEAQIGAARRTYNACVTDLNNALQSFPTNLVAPGLGFTEKPLFEAAAADRAVPDVNALLDR